MERTSDFERLLLLYNTCGKGITIWHWGPIILNGAAQIGENCTLYPGVLIGQKTEGQAAKIGDNGIV